MQEDEERNRIYESDEDDQGRNRDDEAEEVPAPGNLMEFSLN